MPPKKDGGSRFKNTAAHSSNLTLAPRINNVSPDMLQKMFFSTTAKRANVDHFATHPDEAKNARPASFKGISIPAAGRWEPSRAGFASRNDCSYHRDFVELPLDAAPVTRALGQLLGEDAYKGSSAGSGGMPIQKVTTSKAAFPQYDGSFKQLGSYKPENPMHVNPEAKFYESKSAFQRQFPAYDQEDVKRGRAEMVNPRQGVLQKAECAPVYMTAYSREFNRGSATKSAPSLR